MVNRKSLGKTNKTKGSNAERYYAKRFREELNFEKCKTSRLASKLHDNCKIDLCFIPFNVQVKAGKQKGLNVSKELLLMEEEIKKNFSETYPEHKYPKLLIHKKETGKGNKRDEYSELVTMSFDDFIKIINTYAKDNSKG